jgi:hypothetical protein
MSAGADAMAWAERFVEYAERNPGLALDEGAMAGWFANAIENAEVPPAPPTVPMQYEPTPRTRKSEPARKARCDRCGATVWLRQVGTTNDGEPLTRWCTRQGTKPDPFKCPIGGGFHSVVTVRDGLR